MDKQKLRKLLYEAYKNAATNGGANLDRATLQKLSVELEDLDATKVNQWMANRKDLLSRVPEIAGLPAFTDITENPKVLAKDYGFEEGPDFYSMEGSKSWMNKSPTQLRLNAEKYGLELGDYLNKVAELSTKKEQEKQWKDNATALEIKDVPFVGDVNVPGYTSIMLPTSFNKASMGKEVEIGHPYKPWTWGSDVYFDIGTDVFEGGLATVPYGGPIYAALLGNTARQVKQIYDETQDKFYPTQTAAAGAMGAFGTPMVFKGVGEALKRVPGTQGIKPYTRFVKSVEDIGEVSPEAIKNAKVKELTKATDKYRAANRIEQQTQADAANQIAQQMGLISDYVPFNPTAAETRLYGKGSKLWRNVKNGEILTDKEYNDAIKFLQEAERGPDFIPGKHKQSNLYARAQSIKEMPMGDILVNAWSEGNIPRMLREGGRIGGGIAGGRAGISISDTDKKEMANKIINSTEWAKYVTGQPNNLTDEEIYLATMYGEGK